MKLLWLFLILILIPGTAQGTYINDQAFGLGNSFYITVNTTTIDDSNQLSCCDNNELMMRINGSMTNYTAGANKTITSVTLNNVTDVFTLPVTGAAGYLNFSVIMNNVSNSYNLTANAVFVESRNTTADGKVWFNYTGDATLSVSWNNSVAGGTPAANGTPNITAYYNTINGWNQTAMSINAGNSATFNVTVNQTITNASWKVEGAEEQNTSSLQFIRAFNTLGTFNVTAQAFNANGTSNIIYTVVTVTTTGGGGTDWDYLTGTVTPAGSTITINPSVSGSPTTGGAYTFGYVFVDGQTYWVNVTKTGYTANNTQIVFNEDHEVWNVTLNATPSSETTWWNSKTNDDSLVVHVNGTESIEFGLGLATITTANWNLDNTTQAETSANFTTSLNTLGVHSLLAYGNIPTGTTQTVTWKLLSTRVKSGAGDETALLNDTWFDGLTDSMNGSSPDFTQFIGAVVAPYTTQLGALFYVFIYLLPLVIIWLRQEKVLIPSGLLGIFGIALLPMLPEEWRLLAGLCVILTSFGIVYSLFKERG